MAWAVKYRGEFYDLKGLYWRIDVEEDGYGGAIGEMKMGGNALQIEHMAGGDDLLLNPIKGSQATFNIISETNFQWLGLYSAENLKYRTSIYYNSGGYVLYWRGYLTSDYSEPYEDVPYMVSVTATDALGLLKDMPYKYTTTTTDDTYYDGRRYESQVILDCLGKIGFTQFKEFCNIYEDNISEGAGDSPFDQVQIDVDVFRDKNCYEVIEEILKKYNAVIRQTRGEFWLYRPTELKTSGDVYYRYFTAYDTKTDDALSPSPDQLISHPSAVTNRSTFPGGRLMLQGPLKKFTAEQDYGYRESWINNHKFEIERYTAADGFEGWTESVATFRPADVLPVLSFPVREIEICEGEDEGVALYPFAAAVPNSTYYISQTFGSNAIQSSNTLTFSFAYKIVNTTTSPVSASVAIRIKADGYNYWLQENDEVTANWSASEEFIRVTQADVAPGPGSWETYSRSIRGIFYPGPYTVTIYPTNFAGLYACYKDVVFTSTSNQLSTLFKGVKRTLFKKTYVYETTVDDIEEVVGRTYEAINDIAGSELAEEYILGDVEDSGLTNVTEQFMGALCINVGQSLIGVADDFVTDHAAAYVAGGVVVTSKDNKIIFTGNNTTGFTGATGISNTSGNLSGTVANTQTASATTNERHSIQLAGTSGTADVDVEGVLTTATFSGNLNTTAANFVTNNASFYAGADVTVTAAGDTLTFEADNGQFDSSYTTSITNVTGDLTGDVDISAQTYIAGVPQIDTITLTGTSGAANITCDGVTNAAEFAAGTILQHTRSWHTRGNTEAKPVIELIADEMAAQYAREKHFIQMNIRESGTSPDIDVIKNVQDDLNQLTGTTRVFAVNRGTFDVYNREWSIDLIEII